MKWQRNLIVWLVVVGVTICFAASDVFAQPSLQKVIVALGNPMKLPTDTRHTEVPTYLGYYAQEGIELDVVRCSGSLVGTQLVIAGKADIGDISPEVVIKTAQDGVQLTTIYNGFRDYPWLIAVSEDSNITSAKNLKGKKIGISSMGSAGLIYAKSVLKDSGLDPDKDAEIIAVGMGASAVNALKTGQVDALAFWTIAYANMENVGYKFRYLENPEMISRLWTQGSVTTEKNYKARRKVLIGFGRAVAKGTLFSVTNPMAAIKIWHKVNPEMKPVGTEAEISKKIKDDLHIFEATLKSTRIDNRRVKKWGWVDRLDQKIIQDYFYSVGYLKGKLTDQELDRLYADKDFFEEVNNFDAQKVIEQAKNYKD